MKKLILITLFAVFAIAASAQGFNKEYKLLYSDTSTLVTNEEFVVKLYGFLPVDDMQNQKITFSYARVYYLDGAMFVYREETKEGEYLDEITIGQNTYTFKQLYDLIVPVDNTSWQTGAWQVFLQFIF